VAQEGELSKVTEELTQLRNEREQSAKALADMKAMVDTANAEMVRRSNMQPSPWLRHATLLTVAPTCDPRRGWPGPGAGMTGRSHVEPSPWAQR
jgi:hypothetical protein